MKFIGWSDSLSSQTDSHSSDSEHGVILTPCSAVSVIGLVHKHWSQQDCLCTSPMSLVECSESVCMFISFTYLLTIILLTSLIDELF